MYWMYLKDVGYFYAGKTLIESLEHYDTEKSNEFGQMYYNGLFCKINKDWFRIV